MDMDNIQMKVTLAPLEMRACWKKTITLEFVQSVEVALQSLEAHCALGQQPKEKEQ